MKGNRFETATPKNFMKSIKKLLMQGKKYTPVLIMAVILSAVSSYVSVTAPSKLTTLTDVISDGILTEVNLSKVKELGIILALMYFIIFTIDLIQGIIMAKITNKFASEMRGKIYTKINLLPLKYFDKTPHGDILSRVTNDVDVINNSFQESLVYIIRSTVMIIGVIIVMIYTNYIMALTTILSSIIGFALVFLIMKKSQKYFSEKQKAIGDLNGHIEEAYSNIIIVKAYNGKKDTNDKFKEYNETEYKSNRKSQFLSSLMRPIMNFLSNFNFVIVCLVGSLLVINGSITFGVVVGFIYYARLFSNPLVDITESLSQLQRAAAAGERVFEFLDEEELLNEGKKINKNTFKGNIQFKNLNFEYEENKPIINNFNATIKKGQKIAIVGPTGAGKTTLVNILMKFYDIKDGDILIDGVSIKDIRRKDINKIFTMVLQDTWLFEGTIRDNIIFNNKNITDKEINEISTKIGLDHFIKTMNHGLDYKIIDESSISAGQKQLITIARAMINNSPVLILDEATSNVDTRTEELVQKAMDKLTKNKTSFIIAHRLSTIKNADLIFVIKDGNIVEKGNHEDLLKQKGAYAELYNSQFSII